MYKYAMIEKCKYYGNLNIRQRKTIMNICIVLHKCQQKDQLWFNEFQRRFMRLNVFDMLNMEEVNTDTSLSENMHR